MNSIAFLALLLPAAAQNGGAAAQEDDVAALVTKMKSSDPDVSENARRDLLDRGPGALDALRAAVNGEADEGVKERLGDIVTRLEMRRDAKAIVTRWGDRWYGIYRDSLKVGWARLKTEEKEGKILLTDEAYVRSGDAGEVTLKASQLCRANEFLSPERLEVEFASANRSGTYTADLKERRIVLKAGERARGIGVGEEYTTDFASVRLLSIMPRTKGYDLELLRLMGPDLPVLGSMRFEREEAIEFGGRRVKTRRFAFSDGEQEDKYYWVDGKGAVLRMSSAPTVELRLMKDERTAKDLDTD